MTLIRRVFALLLLCASTLALAQDVVHQGPALEVWVQRDGQQLPLAWVGGALAYALGLALSAVLDLPSGAVVVLVMASVCVGLAAGLSRQRPAP